MFTQLYDIAVEMKDEQKLQYNNLFRWYKHIQNLPEIKAFLIGQNKLLVEDPAPRLTFLEVKKKKKWSSSSILYSSLENHCSPNQNHQIFYVNIYLNPMHEEMDIKSKYEWVLAHKSRLPEIYQRDAEASGNCSSPFIFSVKTETFYKTLQPLISSYNF